MREGWEYKKLGDLVNVKTGKLDANASSEDGLYPFFTCSKEPLRINQYSFDCECVLVAGNGELNVKYYKGKFDAYQRTYVITLKDGILTISVPYLYKFFTQYIDVLRNKSIGGVIKYIKLGDITNARIPIPPLTTQQLIVSELDLLSYILDQKRQQLKEYDALAESIFYDMFGDPVENPKGWEKKTLLDFCSNIVDCPHSTPVKADHVTNYPCIRTSELKGGSISWDSMQYLEEEEYQKRIARLKPLPGDIVFGREGTIGDAVLLPDGYSFSLGQRTMLLRASSSVNNYYLHRLLMSEWVKKQIEGVNVSSTVAHLNIKDFKQFLLPLPPLSLQRSFAAKIESIEHQKQLLRASIKETEMLFQSRMDYWFNG